MSVKLQAELHSEFLSLKEGCTGSSESALVKMPHCLKSRVVAHTEFLSLKEGCTGSSEYIHVKMSHYLKITCHSSMSHVTIFHIVSMYIISRLT